MLALFFLKLLYIFLTRIYLISCFFYFFLCYIFSPSNNSSNELKTLESITSTQQSIKSQLSAPNSLALHTNLNTLNSNNNHDPTINTTNDITSEVLSTTTNEANNITTLLLPPVISPNMVYATTTTTNNINNNNTYHLNSPYLNQQNQANISNNYHGSVPSPSKHNYYNNQQPKMVLQSPPLFNAHSSSKLSPMLSNPDGNTVVTTASSTPNSTIYVHVDTGHVFQVSK